MANNRWIGVDLDGTLAHYDEQHGMDRIGQVCAPMLRRVRHWLETGIDVRIVTARAGDATLKSFIQPWLREHNLPALEVTNRRDACMVQLWDDRAIQLEMNTGQILTPRQFVPLVPSGWLGVGLDGVLAYAESPAGVGPIGEPLPVMLNRVRQWQMVGIDVRLFSGRAAEQDQREGVMAWLEKQGLSLPVTCVKDFQMSAFYDVNAVHVIHNTGEPSVMPDDGSPAV